MTPDKVEAALGGLANFPLWIDLRVELTRNDAAYIRDALSVLTEALGERRWRPIESAPRDGRTFLAINVTHGRSPPHIFMCCSRQGGHTYAHNAGWFQPGFDWPAYPTHWQPLPEPPHDR